MVMWGSHLKVMKECTVALVLGVEIRKGRDCLRFGTATDMVVCNTLFRKRLNRLITYESGGCQTQIDYVRYDILADNPF